MANITREEEKKIREFNEKFPAPPYKSQAELVEESRREADRAMTNLKAFNRKHGYGK